MARALRPLSDEDRVQFLGTQKLEGSRLQCRERHIIRKTRKQNIITPETCLQRLTYLLGLDLCSGPSVVLARRQNR